MRSLARHLHTNYFFQKAKTLSILDGKDFFGTESVNFLLKNKTYYKLISDNLSHFTLPNDDTSVVNVCRNIGYHYHEKFISFLKPPEFYPEFIQNISTQENIEMLSHINKSEKPIVFLITHYGGMSLIGPLLAYCKIDLTTITRFPTEEINKLIVSNYNKLCNNLNFGKIDFLNTTESPVMSIALRLRRGGRVVTVVDEHTNFNVNVNFLGKTITAGSGINKLIDFIGFNKIDIYFIQSLRIKNSYKFDIHKVKDEKNYIQEMFDIHEKYVKEHPDQWFFLQEVHENFVDS